MCYGSSPLDHTIHAGAMTVSHTTVTYVGKKGISILGSYLQTLRGSDAGVCVTVSENSRQLSEEQSRRATSMQTMPIVLSPVFCIYFRHYQHSNNIGVVSGTRSQQHLVIHPSELHYQRLKVGARMPTSSTTSSNKSVKTDGTCMYHHAMSCRV